MTAKWLSATLGNRGPSLSSVAALCRFHVEDRHHLQLRHTVNRFTGASSKLGQHRKGRRRWLRYRWFRCRRPATSPCLRAIRRARERWPLRAVDNPIRTAADSHNADRPHTAIGGLTPHQRLANNAERNPIWIKSRRSLPPESPSRARCQLTGNDRGQLAFGPLKRGWSSPLSAC